MAFTRRHFLRSTGVSLTLPFLYSLQARGSKEVAAPRRMITIGLKLGIFPEALFPENGGRLQGDTRYLNILSDHLADLTLFSGLSHENQLGRLSHSSELTWLTSAEHPGLDGFKNTISVDQVASDSLGYTTRFPSMVLSSEGEASQSYNKNGVMIPAEDSPSCLFSTLFLEGTKAEKEYQKRRLRADKSILDGLISQTKSLMRKASGEDRVQLESYLESVRQTEKNLRQAGAWLDIPKPRTQAAPPVDIQDKGNIDGRIKLMFDMIPLILESDASRVINMGIQVDHGIIKMDGVFEEHHSLSHHGQDPTKIKKLIKVESAIMSRLAQLLTNLNKKETGGSRILDNTSILIGSNLGNANNHHYRNLPIIVAGGPFRHGNHVTYDKTRNTPLSNLFLSMLQATGVEEESFGSSTGTLNWS